MEKIKYSFIIPHFSKDGNIALLERCIDSIPERNDVEIIIVDNSPVEIDFQFKKRNIVICKSEKGKGAGEARNVGIDISNGQWLLFADADDYYVDGIIEFMDKHVNHCIDILYFNVTSDNLDSVSRGNIINKKYIKLFETDIERVRFFLYAPWNKVFRKDFIVSNNLRFEVRPSGNDAWFTLRASDLAKNTIVTNNVYYCLTDQKESITFGKTLFQVLYPKLDLLLRIDSFYKKKNMRDLTKPIISPTIILSMLKRDGVKNVLCYCWKIHSITSLSSYFLRGVLFDMNQIFKK